MFVTLLLLFLNTGPLNAAMANVLPADAARPRLRGSTPCPSTCSATRSRRSLIGVASDRIGLRMPVLVTGLLLVVAGLVLLAGRRALRARPAAAGVTS